MDPLRIQDPSPSCLYACSPISIAPHPPSIRIFHTLSSETACLSMERKPLIAISMGAMTWGRQSRRGLIERRGCAGHMQSVASLEVDPCHLSVCIRGSPSGLYYPTSPLFSPYRNTHSPSPAPPHTPPPAAPWWRRRAGRPPPPGGWLGGQTRHQSAPEEVKRVKLRVLAMSLAALVLLEEHRVKSRDSVP